jgi:hypothetical protein
LRLPGPPKIDPQSTDGLVLVGFHARHIPLLELTHDRLGLLGGTIPAFETGGKVSTYGCSREAQNGQTSVLVGKRGPKVVMLSGGAQVMNTEGSRVRWDQGGVESRGHINAPVNSYDELQDTLVDSVGKTWGRANQMHERNTDR